MGGRQGDVKEMKEGNVLFNDGSNTCKRSWKGNLMPPLHGLLFPISSNGYFICTILQIG